MRFVQIILALVAFCLGAPALHAAPADKVLLVVSSHGRDAGKTRPGFEYDEFAQAWTILRANRVAVEVASPAGGAAEPDEYEADKPYNRQALADPAAAAALSATRAIRDIKAEDYAAVYLIGGGGAMFDLFADAGLQALLARVYEQGGVVGGVCHGPAVLANVRLSDGQRLVEGRKVTGYTDAEEAGFGKRWAASYPIFLEAAMKRSGARFEQGRAMLPFAVADGRIVTGQNPFSTAMSVELLLRALGREPVARQAYPDERSLLLVASLLDGRGEAARADFAAAAPAAFDAMTVGIYGNFVASGAGDNRAAVAQGLELMELAATRVSHPRLATAMAQARRRLELGTAAAPESDD